MLEIAPSKAFLNRTRRWGERDGEKAMRVFQPLQIFLGWKGTPAEDQFVGNTVGKASFISSFLMRVHTARHISFQDTSKTVPGSTAVRLRAA